MATDVAALAVGATDFDRLRAVRWGFYGAVTAIFIASIGLAEAFHERLLIAPFLSLGYVFLMWVPFGVGFQASHEKELEGIETAPKGMRNVAAGALAGTISGASMAAFIVLVDAIDVSDILLNVDPKLRAFLTFSKDVTDINVARGVILSVLVGLILGAVGGAMHLVGAQWRKAFSNVLLYLLFIRFIELVFEDVFGDIGLGSVYDLMFTSAESLTWGFALLFSAVVVFLSIRFEGRTKSARARFTSLPTQRRRTIGFFLALLLVVAGMVLPQFFGLLLNDIMSTVGLFMLMGLGLNIVVGFAGLLDLGYVAFFAVGAYTMAVLTSPLSPKISPEMAFFASIPFVIIMAAIAGLIVGTPVIRMRGDYLAIVTLAFGEIARILFQSDWLTPTFGGAQGIVRISEEGIRTFVGWAVVGAGLIALLMGLLRLFAARSFPASAEGPGAATAVETRPWDRKVPLILIGGGVLAILFGLIWPTFVVWTVVGTKTDAIFRFVLLFVVLAAFVSWRLQESRVGRAWMAMREDEHVAEAMGINIVTSKLMAFVIGAVLAALGGALFAVKIQTIFPSSFKIIQSIIILVIVIVGGMGSIRGVAIGALVLIGILGGPTSRGLLAEFAEFKLLIYGTLLVMMMLLRPEGLLPSARRTQELHQEEFQQDAWLAGGDREDDQGDGE